MVDSLHNHGYIMGEDGPLFIFILYKARMTTQNISMPTKNEVLGIDDGTTGPEWGDRVGKIVEDDNKELEQFTVPEDAFVSNCRICGKRPTSVFVVVNGKSKYQYRCMRCGNIGTVANNEFEVRGTWNIENGGQVALLRKFTDMFEAFSMDIGELLQIKLALKEIVQCIENGTQQTFEIKDLIKSVIQGYGDETTLQIKMDAKPLSGSLTSDIPETIRIVNSSSNEAARATEVGFNDITRSMDSIAAAIANITISTK